LQGLAMVAGGIITVVLRLVRVVFQIIDTFWLFIKAAIAVIG
jgi:hypothetical protein